MSEQRRFGETDHEPLREDDILAQDRFEIRDRGVELRVGEIRLDDLALCLFL